MEKKNRKGGGVGVTGIEGKLYGGGKEEEEGDSLISLVL